MPDGLRVVTFNAFPSAYELVAEWARRNGHELVLLVTMPATDDRYGTDTPLTRQVPESQDVLLTRRLKRTAAPVIAALQPDLIVSVTFPRRIPAEVTSIPKYGAINVHPSPLPRGRGPNPQRTIYDGDPELGATAHRIEPEFDAGAILAQRRRPLRDDATAPDVLRAWYEMVAEVLAEGTERAANGEPGAPQDDTNASYAGRFTDEERWLSFDEPALTVQRRAVALNLMGTTARVRLDGGEFWADDVRARTTAGDKPAGTVLEHKGDLVTVATADGAVDVTVRPLA